MQYFSLERAKGFGGWLDLGIRMSGEGFEIEALRAEAVP